MPLNYGEGKELVIRRLRRHINDDMPERISFYVPFPRNRRFVRREDILEKLR